jgi:ribonuclease VapC
VDYGGNLGEIWYQVARRRSEPEADASVDEIRELGFEVESAGWELTRQAAALKARYAVSYADCFAAALAQRREAELVTGDPEFQRLDEEVKIRWLPASGPVAGGLDGPVAGAEGDSGD